MRVTISLAAMDGEIDLFQDPPPIPYHLHPAGFREQLITLFHRSTPAGENVIK